MGSIRQRKESGCLFIDFRFQNNRCRELTALEDAPTNRKRLEKLLEKIESAIEAGTFKYADFFPNSKLAAHFAPPVSQSAPSPGLVRRHAGPSTHELYLPETPLFSDFAETWFSEKQVEWRQSYQTCIRDVLDKRLIPEFGSRKLAVIMKSDVLAYRAQLGKSAARGKTSVLSNSRINRIMNAFRQIMNEGASRYDFRSPFDAVKQLRVKRTDVQPFPINEVVSILNTVRQDFRDYYTVRFFTGMRTGEIDGLKWKYVDFERRLILIRETIVLMREEYTKTDSSQRDIQMSQVVFDALKKQHDLTGKLGAYVFCSKSGTPLDHKNVTKRVWYPLLRYLNIQLRRPYQTRHTAATLWLAAGENPEWIARQMGHSTTEMLFRVYSRFVPNLTRRDGSAFERLLQPVFGQGLLNTTQQPTLNEGDIREAIASKV